MKKKLLLIYTVISFSFVALEIFMTEFSTVFGTSQQMSTTEGKKFLFICPQHIAWSALSKKYYSFWERRETKKNIFEGHVSWLFSLLSTKRTEIFVEHSHPFARHCGMCLENIGKKKLRSFITVVEKPTVKTCIKLYRLQSTYCSKWT